VREKDGDMRLFHADTVNPHLISGLVIINYSFIQILEYFIQILCFIQIQESNYSSNFENIVQILSSGSVCV